MPKYVKISKNVTIKIIGRSALKKKSTVSFAITDGKANAIPSLAQAISQVKKSPIIPIAQLPTFVPSINQVISNSRTINAMIGRHLIFFSAENIGIQLP